MSFLQSLSAVGIILGYLVGSLAADAEYIGIQEHFNWRRALVTQGVALVLIGIALVFIPNDQLDILAKEKKALREDRDDVMS